MGPLLRPQQRSRDHADAVPAPIGCRVRRDDGRIQEIVAHPLTQSEQVPDVVVGDRGGERDLQRQDATVRPLDDEVDLVVDHSTGVGRGVSRLGAGLQDYRWTISNTTSGPPIAGYTGDRRFFMAWALVWRAIAREDELVQQLTSDPHSPPEFRVNGVVRNMDAWYDAFGVTEEDAMYLPPDERVRIW